MSTDPLGMTPEEMRRLGHWLVDRVVDHVETNGEGPAIRTGRPAALRELLGGPPPQSPSDPLESMQLLSDVALRAHAARRPSPLLRARARAVVVHRRAGRVDGHRLQRDRRLVEGRLRPGHGRACRAGLAARAAGAARGDGGRAGQRRLAGQRHRAGRRPGRGRPRRGLPVRSDPLVDRARAAGAGLPARPRAGAADRRRPAPHRRDRCGRRRRRPGGGPPPRLRHRQRRHHQHGLGGRAARARAPLSRARPLVSRGRRLRRPGGAVRAWAAGAGRDRAGRLAGARPAQVAVPALRRRLPAGAPPGGARPGLSHDARVPAGRARDHRGGGLPQPQPGAVAALAGAQAVADLPHARADRDLRRDRPRHRAGGARGGVAAGRCALRGGHAGAARHRHLRRCAAPTTSTTPRGRRLLPPTATRR